MNSTPSDAVETQEAAGVLIGEVSERTHAEYIITK